MIRLLILLSTILFLSCSSGPEKITNYEIKSINGIENIINDNKPSVTVEEMNISLKKTLEINGNDSDKTYFTNAKYFTVNSNYDIYVFDDSDYMIHRFDKNGKHVSAFGGKGTGPGEFQFVMGMCCLEDTLFVVDTPVKKMNRFDLDGKFINSSNMPAFTSLYNRIFTARCLMWIQRLSFKRITDKVEMHKVVEARESSLHRIAILDSSSIDYPPKDIKGELSVSKDVAVSDSSIFIADKGEFFKYEIKEYDSSFKLKRVIRKKYSRLKVTDYENNIAIEELKNNNIGITDEEITDYISHHDYKPAIRWIYTDKYGRLWVEESRTLNSIDDSKMKFSIFRNGIYLNSVLFDLGIKSVWLTYDLQSYGRIQFLGNYIYILNTNNNNLSIYEY